MIVLAVITASILAFFLGCVTGAKMTEKDQKAFLRLYTERMRADFKELRDIYIHELKEAYRERGKD